jgi:hypothetical protein
MIIPFKKGQYQILLQMIIKSLLLDGTLHHILGQHLIHKLMTDLVPATEKLDLDVKLVLEHVVRRVKVVLEFLDVGDLETEVT